MAGPLPAISKKELSRVDFSSLAARDHSRLATLCRALGDCHGGDGWSREIKALKTGALSEKARADGRA